MRGLFKISLFAVSALSLVSRDRRHADHQLQNLEARHRGWKTASWYGTGYNGDYNGLRHKHAQTVTVTVTVTVDATFPNATSTLDDGLTTTSTDELAPITLIDLSTPPAISTTDFQETVPSSTAEDDLAPDTLIDIDTAVTAPAVTSAVDEAAPTPNDLAPITLITLGV